MKRKRAIEAMEAVSGLTRRMGGFMTVTNDETGETYEVDMPSMLAISRGVMAWACGLLSREGDVGTEEALRQMLTDVARSLEAELCGGHGE